MSICNSREITVKILEGSGLQITSLMSDFLLNFKEAKLLIYDVPGMV